MKLHGGPSLTGGIKCITETEADKMALAEAEIAPKILTYEDYLREGEINQRYDIIDGVRIFYMASPSIPHQEYGINVLELLRAYQRQTRRGRTLNAPLDILVSRFPLRTRQPDVLFISAERLQEAGGNHADVPLTVAPEIVVEVLSGSDTRRVRAEKIADYCLIGVNERWLVSPEGETVEVLRLTPEGPVREALYGSGQTLQSLTFPDMTLALDDIFRIEE